MTQYRAAVIPTRGISGTEQNSGDSLPTSRGVGEERRDQLPDGTHIDLTGCGAATHPHGESDEPAKQSEGHDYERRANALPDPHQPEYQASRDAENSSQIDHAVPYLASTGSSRCRP